MTLFLSDIYSSRRFLIFGKRGITLSLFLFPKTLITPDFKSKAPTPVATASEDEDDALSYFQKLADE